MGGFVVVVLVVFFVCLGFFTLSLNAIGRTTVTSDKRAVCSDLLG